jgi:hypothetical protein
MPQRWYRSLLSGAVVLALVVGGSAQAIAQSPTVITGRITNRAAAPVAGATVQIEGTQLGAIAGDDGTYTLNVPASRTGSTVNVTARLIGYRMARSSVTLSGGRQTLDFSLISQPTQLNEVVVTALSQQREKATIGSSQQEVSGAELTRTQTTNVISAMSGKVSGLQISQSGNMGGSSRVVIRGAGSILGNNQPLFVIDGVPMANSNLSTANASGTAAAGGAVGSRDYGSAISDLNMDDVASVTVLKGPIAAALYGSWLYHLQRAHVRRLLGRA